MKRLDDPRMIFGWREWLDYAEGIPPGTWVALDLETTGLSPWKDSIAVVGLYDPVGHVAGVLHFPRSQAERELGWKAKLPVDLVAWLSHPDRRFVGHNVVGFDAYFLHNAGVDVFGPEWFDTLTAEGVCMKAARRDLKKSLAAVYKRRLGADLKKEIDHKTWQAETLSEEQLAYVAADIVHIPRLREVQLADVANDSRAEAMALEMELLKVVMRMTINGMPLKLDADPWEPGQTKQWDDHRQGFRWYIEERMASLRDHWAEEIEATCGHAVNMNSPVQIKNALRALNIETPSTDLAALTALRDGADLDDENGRRQHKLATLLMRMKTANQRTKMYGVDKFGRAWFETHVVDGVVHPRYWQVGTDTGRFSCSDPNLQQVGKDCRSFFGEKPGHLCLTADYSQLEVVITAWLANDPAFIDAILTGDVHEAMARRIFGIPDDVPVSEFKPKRRMAKAGVFTFLFGGGATQLYETAKTQGASITLAEARDFEAAFFAALPGLDRRRNKARYFARNSASYTVTMPHGLIRHLGGGDLRPTTIMNTEVQGGAASGLKMALAIMARLKIDQFLCGTVHDEVIVIAPAEWFDADPENLYAEPSIDPMTLPPLEAIKGELNRYVHWAMRQGMLAAFAQPPGGDRSPLWGMEFPVKVGLTLGPRWGGGEAPHTEESISVKAQYDKRADGNPGPEERGDAVPTALEIEADKLKARLETVEAWRERTAAL